MSFAATFDHADVKSATASFSWLSKGAPAWFVVLDANVHATAILEVQVWELLRKVRQGGAFCLSLWLRLGLSIGLRLGCLPRPLFRLPHNPNLPGR